MKTLGLAFADGLLFYVGVKLAQGSANVKEQDMDDLGPLAERLRKIEDRNEHRNGAEPLLRPGESLDRRLLEKIMLALEARLEEHIGHIDRRVAEMDAKLALDLQAAETEIGELRGDVEAGRQESTQQIAGVDRQLTELKEALPAKFREIIDAVRQSMEARVALEIKELEVRMHKHGDAPRALAEVESKLCDEVQALAAKVADMERAGQLPHADLAALEQKIAALQQGIPEVEAKLTTLREELPPKIRQIVEAVENSMCARLAASNNAFAAQLQHHADQASAVDQKLATLQAELPPKIKAIVDAVQQSLETKMAAELERLQRQHEAQIQQSGAAGSWRKELEEALQYVSLLESRVQTLERNLQHNFEGTVDRAAERVWRSLEARLPRHAPQPAASASPGSITDLRQKSTSTEQSVLDLIAGLGQLFDKPGAASEPRVIGPDRGQQAPAAPMPDAETPSQQPATAEETDPKEPSVIPFKPKEPEKNRRIPFVS